MRDFPTDPMRQHNRFIAAFCDDLFDMWVNGGTGTPKSDRVAEISRQINRGDASDEARAASLRPQPPAESSQSGIAIARKST